MFFFDLFMGFVYKHLLFRKLLMYLLYTVVGFFIAVVGILYVDTGELVFDRHILFSSQIYTALLDNHKNAIYMMIILEQFLFIGVLLWQNNRLKNRSNCSVKYVHIEDIAAIWLQNQRIKENIKKEVIAESKKEFNTQGKKPPLYVNFKKQRSNELFNNIVMPHIDRLLDEEVDIIIELLRLIEDKGQDIPSVVSFTEKDPEIKYKKDILTEDGLTSYQILRKVSLYDHTLNVIDSIYEELKKHSKTNYVLLLGKAIIAALAHDIGKIKKMEERLENISLEIFSSQPHYQISKIFFMKMYPNYRDKKIVIEAIENHHAIKLPSGNDLVKLLVSADKGARDYEIDEFFKTVDAQAFCSQSEVKKDKSIPKTQRQTGILSDKTGIDIDSPFEDYNDELEEMKAKKERKAQKETSLKKPKQQKTDFTDFKDEKDYETDEAFNIEDYENDILELLKEKINISKSLGYETIFYSISYKDMVLFNFNTIVMAVEKAIGFKVNSRELAMHFIRTYRKKGDIGYIDIDNNYTTSKFYIEKNGNMIEYDAVPIFARVFNMNENDLFQLKLLDEHTKDARVLTNNEVSK